MNYQKQYADKINWKNSPDTSTPLNATNMNKMDNALWYMDNALYTISKAIGGGSSARGGIISNVGNNAFTTHIHQRTGEDLAENELLILRSDVSGTGNKIYIYTDVSSAIDFGLVDLDGESTSITVTTDSVVVLMITDADTDYTAQVLAVIDTSGGGGTVYAGLGIGKKTGVSSNIIDTDIDLYRDPIAGDRLLVYFDEKITSPTGLKTYNNGVAVTSNLENVTPLYINAGWNILQFMNDGLLYRNVWVRKQNVPVPSTLAGMSDTLIVSPSDGQLLTFDNESQKWKNKTYVEANIGTAVTELKKLKVGNVVYDTDGMKNYSVSNVANNNITVSVLNSNQFVQEVIAINTGNHTGSSSAWNLVLNDGMNPVIVALTRADGTAFNDDISENQVLFVYVDTAGNVAQVLDVPVNTTEIKTVSGNPITLTDALAGNALEVSAEIVASQSGSGTPSPTNVRPISGFSSVTITREDAQGQTATVTVALGQTVYGGTLDLTTGVLTVTHTYMRISTELAAFYREKVGTVASLFSWDMGSANHGVTHGDAVVPDIISNYLPKTSAGGIWSTDASGITTKNDGARIWLRIQGCTTASEIETYTNNNALYACWELETPTTTTLTAAQLALVKGQNTLTANCKSINLTYRADAVATKADESQICTNVEIGATASKAYTVNDFMLRTDGLYKVTANIASGGSITSSNTTKVTITDVLTALLNA